VDTNNKSFCVYAWTHMMVTASGKPVRGEYWPCCNWTPHNDNILHSKGFNVKESTIADFWQSNEMNKIRSMMLDGKPVAGCQACYDEERNGTASLRQQENNGWSRHKDLPNIHNTIKRWQDTGFCPEPVSIDINFSSLCNLKCRMCFSGLSSELAKEQWGIIQKEGWDVNHELMRFQKDDLEIIDHGKNNQLMNELYDQFKDIKRIYLKGGEPTLLQTMYDYLNYPVDQGQAEEIQIKFNTNMTNVQKRFVQLMDRFKKVDLTMSIDGVGDVQEYIRAPSKWKAIDKNITYFIENNHKADLMVSPCWQIYNLFYIKEHLEYFDKLNKKRKVEVTPILLDFPMHYRIDTLPFDVREQAIDKVKECFTLEISKQPTLYKKLYTLLKMLQDTKQNVEKHMNQFVQVTKLYDKHRNQSIEKSLPELYKHVKKYF
jgi:MoaA/NifB/PqqE/SkfB family radical SAM enzyme